MGVYFFDEAAKSVTDGDLRRFIILGDGMRGFDITSDLAKISCPVFAIGSKDVRILGADATLQIAECLKDSASCKLYLYDGYGHAVYDTAPDIKERILRFLVS